MNLKTILLLSLIIFSVNAFSQTDNKLSGVWKLVATDLDGFYHYDIESNAVTLEGITLWVDEVEQKKMKDDIKSKSKKTYIGFNENSSYASYFGESLSKGTFRIEYGELILESNTIDRYDLSIDNVQKFTISSEENDLKTKYGLVFKKMPANEILALKNDKAFSGFQTELQLSKSENEEKYNKEQASNKESEIRNARENQEKADRLNREQSNSNKFYKSNISITKAIEIIREKLAEDQILSLVKNEKIKSKYSTDTNLYKCTLSVSDTEEFHIWDYKGKKTLFLTVAEAESRDSLTDLYYEYEQKIESWFKSNGSYKKGEGWDDRVLQDDVIKVTIHLYANGNSGGYVLQIEFEAS